MYTNIWIVEEVYKNLPIESFQGYLDANNLDYNFFGDDSIYRNHYQSFASPMQFYWGKNFGMGTIRKKSGFPYLDLKLALALPTKISGNWILDLSLLQQAIKLTITDIEDWDQIRQLTENWDVILVWIDLAWARLCKKFNIINLIWYLKNSEMF